MTLDYGVSNMHIIKGVRIISCFTHYLGLGVPLLRIKQ